MSGMKRRLREWEARLTPWRRARVIDGVPVRLTRSLWWDETNDAFFSREIEPYWQAWPARELQLVWDLGAASGMFTLSVCVRLPRAKVVAFEPSLRQRLLLERNVARNGFAVRVTVEPYAAWNRRDALIFRTHGAISALQATGEHLGALPFNETVPAISLDEWNDRADRRQPVGLVKMDIEGAEIEALEGMGETLTRHRPVMLIQAYHRRRGTRTYEACERILRKANYRCREMEPGKGFLVAEPAGPAPVKYGGG